MSDMTAMEAFDNVLDRLIESEKQRAGLEEKAHAARHEIGAMRQTIEDLQRAISRQKDEIFVLKAGIPPDELKALDLGDIPF